MPEPTEAEQAKARRVQVILYAVMGVFIFLPLILYWLRSRK